MISLFSFPSETDPAKVGREDLLIPSRDPGVSLYVRNKRLAGGGDPGRAVLFVHGATYPASTGFDLALSGLSWMDYLACHGWDVYGLDLRGYGGSTRPPEMNRPPLENAPVTVTREAVQDLATVVDQLLLRCGLSTIALIGWSWGTVITGAYAAKQNGKVSRLILYAPLWVSREKLSIDGGEPLGAYRTVSMDTAKERWLKGVPVDKKEDLIPPGWYDTWAAATQASDPVGARRNPPVLRAPNGVVLDGRDYWAAGRPYYDPADIRVPTLVVHGEWDADTPGDMARAVFAGLVNAPWRRLTVIGEGTHTVIMERNRLQLFREVQLFLEEPAP